MLNRFGGATRWKVVVILKGYKLGTSELLIVWKSDCLNRRYETLLA